jgi:hypothetical protein
MIVKNICYYESGNCWRKKNTLWTRFCFCKAEQVQECRLLMSGGVWNLMMLVHPAVVQRPGYDVKLHLMNIYDQRLVVVYVSSGYEKVNFMGDCVVG